MQIDQQSFAGVQPFTGGKNRPIRQEYRDLIDSLPAERQVDHLRALLLWLRLTLISQQ